MTLKATTFRNGDWVVLTKELKEKGSIDDCTMYCVTHTRKTGSEEAGKDIVFAEKIESLDAVDAEAEKIFDFSENFTATGMRDMDVTLERHMGIMSLIFGNLTDKERNEIEEQYCDYLDERKAFYDDELEFSAADYTLAQAE